MGRTTIQEYDDWYEAVKRGSEIEPRGHFSLYELKNHFAAGITVNTMIHVVKKAAAKQ